MTTQQKYAHIKNALDSINMLIKESGNNMNYLHKHTLIDIRNDLEKEYYSLEYELNED